jgi:hypothetical protein
VADTVIEAAEVMFYLAQGTQRLSTLQCSLPEASKKC